MCVGGNKNFYPPSWFLLCSALAPGKYIPVQIGLSNPWWSRKKVSESSTYCSPKPLRWKDLYLWANPMVRQEAVWGPPCQESQLLDDLVSWHRYNFDNFDLRSVHSTGQKNPCIRKFILGVKFQFSPSSMSFNNGSIIFWKITLLKGSKTLHLLVVKQKVYHLFFVLFLFNPPANRLKLQWKQVWW